MRSATGTVKMNITYDCVNKVQIYPIQPLFNQTLVNATTLTGFELHTGIKVLEPVQCPPQQIKILKNGIEHDSNCIELDSE